ncbi:hypothetical protein ElyMa_000975200 [Elysia marginata]|uniref:Uncharacterized protein n=1 Tax=Elysia marginata TaxID=1093978 RepID=A0AAV4HES2_9GAST|nr:hypothetical protein ElyMa_000975200 [Elysia marginata]
MVRNLISKLVMYNECCPGSRTAVVTLVSPRLVFPAGPGRSLTPAWTINTRVTTPAQRIGSRRSDDTENTKRSSYVEDNRLHRSPTLT